MSPRPHKTTFFAKEKQVATLLWSSAVVSNYFFTLTLENIYQPDK